MQAVAARSVAAATEAFFPCPLYGEEKINEAGCTDQCSIVSKNQNTCSASACASPWRLCLACVKQGYKKLDARVVNAQLGVCRFHGQHGPESDRNDPAVRAKALEIAADKPRQRHAAIKPEILFIEPGRIRPMPHQPREYIDKEELERLQASIKMVGQREAGQVRKLDRNQSHEWELIDGQRRWLVCTALGIKFKCYVVEIVDAEQQFEISVASNCAKADHTSMELARAIRRMMTSSRKRTIAEVAAIMGRSESSIHQHIKLLQLDPQLQEALDPRKPEGRQITFSAAVELSDLPYEEQRRLLPQILAQRMTIAQTRHAVRNVVQAKNIARAVKRGRKPSDTYGLLTTFVQRARRDTEMWLQTDPAVLGRIFEHRPPQDRRELIKEMRATAQRLERLAQALS